MTVAELVITLAQMMADGTIKPNTIVARSAGEDPKALLIVRDVSLGRCVLYEHYGPDFKHPPRPPKRMTQKCIVLK